MARRPRLRLSSLVVISSLLQVSLDFLPDSTPLTVDFNSTDESTVRRRLGWRRASLDPPILLERPSPGALDRRPPAGGRRKLQSMTVEVRVVSVTVMFPRYPRISGHGATETCNHHIIAGW